MNGMNYEEIGKALFGDTCPKTWGDDRPWRVERYTRPSTPSCHHPVDAVRIVTAHGHRINLTERVMQFIVNIVNEAN